MPFVPDSGATPVNTLPTAAPRQVGGFVPDAPTATAKKPGTGIFSRLIKAPVVDAFNGFKESVAKRQQREKEALSRGVNHQEGPVAVGAELVGETAGIGADTVGAAIEPVAKPVLKGLYNISAAVRNVVEKGTLEDLKKRDLLAAADAMDRGEHVWQNFKEKHPDTAGIVSAIGNLANFGLTFAGGEAAVKGVEEGIQTGKAAATATKEAVGSGLEAAAGAVGPSLENVGKTGSIIAQGAEKHGISQVTGWRPDTVARFLENPSSFSQEAMANLSRGSLAQRVKGAIDTAITDVSHLGKEYKGVREARVPVDIKRTVSGLPDFVVQTLEKMGLKVDQEGKVGVTARTKLTNRDLPKLQEFLDQYAQEKNVDSDVLLNARQGLDNLSHFEKALGETGANEAVARALRKGYDEFAKKVPGLKALDKKFGPKIEQLKQLRDDFLNPDGSLSDNATNKIANITGAGKDLQLSRLEKLLPGISDDIRLLKSFEDIAGAGQRPGSYFKGGAVGALAGSVVPGLGTATGALAGIVLSTPELAVPLLQKYAKLRGWGLEKIEPIISKLKAGAKPKGAEKKILDEAVQSLETQQ